MSSISADGATVTLYIQQIENVYFYKQNVDGSPTSFTFPLTISNSNATPASNVLKVLFASNLALTATTDYIVIDSSGIQIGDTSVKSDGTRPTITVNVDNYPGFIRNGTGTSDGYANVYIYNLVVDGTGRQTAEAGGWIGQEYYGRSVTNNYIVNCSSYGAISSFGGGIVGQTGGSGTIGVGGELTIQGCSSYGTIAQYAGGIAGHYPGYLGTLTCEKCWSEGSIGSDAGGIFGQYGGIQGTAVAQKCYSIGSIGTNAGGIFGPYAAEQGQGIAEDCYSRGSIGTDAGGIYGSNAATADGSTFASNCYSSGSIGGGGGIYGTGATGGANTTSCYSANGIWDSATAQTSIGMGSYISVVSNQPFELRAFGPSPYSLITVVNNQVNASANLSVAAGSSTSGGVLAGLSSYSILEIDGESAEETSSITVNSTTGAISATSQTASGEYVITLRAVVNSYSITRVILTVTEAPPAPSPTAVPTVLRGKGYDFEIYNDTQVGNVLVRERLAATNLRFKSFEDYNKYLKSRTTLR